MKPKIAHFIRPADLTEGTIISGIFLRRWKNASGVYWLVFQRPGNIETHALMMGDYLKNFTQTMKYGEHFSFIYKGKKQNKFKTFYHLWDIEETLA